jgi:hypothetical protein
MGRRNKVGCSATTVNGRAAIIRILFCGGEGDCH